MMIPGVIASGFKPASISTPNEGTNVSLPAFVAGTNMIFDTYNDGAFDYSRATRGAGTTDTDVAKANGAVSTGKWYIEIDTTLLDNMTSEIGVGHDTVTDYETALYLQSSVWSVSNDRTGVYTGGVDVSNGVDAILEVVEGSRMMIALDLDNGKLWIGRDGSWNPSVDPPGGAVADADGLTAGSYVPFISLFKRDTYMLIPSLSDGLLYAPPTGFSYWPGGV